MRGKAVQSETGSRRLGVGKAAGKYRLESDTLRPDW